MFNPNTMQRFIKAITLLSLSAIATLLILGPLSGPELANAAPTGGGSGSPTQPHIFSGDVEVENLEVTGTCTGCGVESGAFDLNGETLTVDADADTTITADTDDQIDVAIGGNDLVRFLRSGVYGIVRALETGGKYVDVFHDAANGMISSSSGYMIMNGVLGSALRHGGTTVVTATTGGGISTLAAPTSTLLRLGGTSTTTSHSLGETDVLFAADTETNGLAWLDGGFSVLSDIFGRFGSSDEVKIGWDTTDADAYSLRVGLPDDLTGNNMGAIWFGAQSDVIGTDINIETGDSYVLGIFQAGGAYAAGTAAIDGVASFVGVGTKQFQFLNPASGQVFGIGSDGTTTTFAAESGTDLALEANRVFGLGGYVPNTTRITNADTPYTILVTDHYLDIDTTSGVVTATLPAIGATNDGQMYCVTDDHYNAAVNNITIARTGSDKINNVSGDFSITASTTTCFKANNVTKNWQIASQT